jgi:hypothetical protein
MGKHYIPQEYLKAFKTEGRRPSIWMYDKQTREWSNAAIKRVAQQRGYFTPDVERALARIEGPGHRAMSLLRANLIITARQRDDLALYIAVLVMRVPRKRRRATELVPGILESVVTNIRSELNEARGAVGDERIEDLLTQLSDIEARYQIEPPAHVKELIENPWPSEQVLGAIDSMTWRLLKARPPLFFVTTDNPAYYFDSLGVGSQDSEMTFPISPGLALIGSFQSASSQTVEVHAVPSIVEEVNRRVISGAERFVFAYRKEDWIAALAADAMIPLNRIRW